MSTHATRPAPTSTHARDFTVWQVPPLDTERRLITGAAAGVAREIGIDPIYTRVSFVLLTLAGGWGVVLYLGAWAVMARVGMGTDYVPIAKAATSRSRGAAFAMIITGLVVLSNTYGITFLGALVWPIVFIGGAIAVGLDQSRLAKLRAFGEVENRAIGARIALGLALLFAGVVSASFVSLSFWQATGGVAVAALVIVGAGIVFAPVISSLGRDLLAERRRRIRSEERADMAAHLHDSVLQTLSLIQRRSNDSSVVALARRQERELRTWLFEDRALKPNLGFRSGLEAIVAAVEELHQVPIELVVVGDCLTDDDVDALLQAAREAMTNASRHAGAPRIDVFAEVGHQSIELFVRDTGVGFEVDAVEADRAGVRDSIIGRMQRHGGAATVTSTPGLGTEVELVLPRRNATNPEQVEVL